MIEHADPEGGGKFTSRNRKSTGTRSASCLPKERGHWTETGAAVRRWTGTGKRITRNGVKSVKRNRSTATTKRDHEQHNWNKKPNFSFNPKKIHTTTDIIVFPPLFNY
jgi:hypothetical protein